VSIADSWPYFLSAFFVELRKSQQSSENRTLATGWIGSEPVLVLYEPMALKLDGPATLFTFAGS
jgi:hypothetical protein